MTRARSVCVALLATIGVIGIPPMNAIARTPPTVDREVVVEGGSIAAASNQAARFERSFEKLPINANLVAVSFRSAADDAALEDLIVEARFRTEAGWSGWERLIIEPEEGPDQVEAGRGSDRVFTEPIWVGTADALDLRYRAPSGGASVRDLRLHLINTLGDATVPNIFQKIVGAFSDFFNPSKAHAMTVQPSIITRAQWGADESIRECCPRYAETVHMAFVHHTAGTNSYTASQSPAIVRSIYAFHVKNRGWSDIGYNFLVDRYGQVFEGRYGGMAEPVIGAHVKGFNTGSTGVSLMGTFTSASPTSSMVSSLKKLLAWKLDVHHAPPVGTVVMTSGGSPQYPVGTKKSFNRISGHRDGQQTSCPGSQTYKLLPSIRNAVKAIGLPKLYLPRVNSEVLRRDGDGVNEYVRVEGDFTTTVNWTVSIRDAEGVSILKSFVGQGTKATVWWDGFQSDGKPARSGPIAFVIEGTDLQGHPVRPGGGTFFLVTNHPDGTLLKSPTQTVFLEDGEARPVENAAVQSSWFRANEAVTATDQAIDVYPGGTAILPREGAILSNAGSYHMFSDGKLREFDTPEVYAALGYTAASALPMTDEEMAGLPKGMKIDDPLTHPFGAAVRAVDGTTWTIGEGIRRKHSTALVRQSWYREAEVVTATPLDGALPIGDALTYRDGTMFELPDGTHWLYAGGVRLGIEEGLFEAMGYTDAAALAMSSGEAGAIPDLPFGHYPPIGVPVTGDWNGDGTDTPGAVRGNKWYLHDDTDGEADHVFAFGLPTDRPIVGDWDGDGVSTPGVIRGNQWFLSNDFDGDAEIATAYGSATDAFVAGDWDGDGDETPGVARGNMWYLNEDFDGDADVPGFAFGSATDRKVAGDWDGNGRATPGVIRGNIWYLNKGFQNAVVVPAFGFGLASDQFVVGDWNGDDSVTPGVVRIWTWYLLNVNATAVPDTTFIDLG